MFYYHIIFLLEFYAASLPLVFVCNGSLDSYAVVGSVTICVNKLLYLLVIYIGMIFELFTVKFIKIKISRLDIYRQDTDICYPAKIRDGIYRPLSGSLK